MSNHTAKQNTEDRKKKFTRMLCLILAGVMVLSVVASAIFSNF